MNTSNANGTWEENRKVVYSRIDRLEEENAALKEDVSTLKEGRALLFSENERLSGCVKENTEGIGKNNTRLAVLALKIAMLGVGGGVGGGVGTVLVKTLLK